MPCKHSRIKEETIANIARLCYKYLRIQNEIRLTELKNDDDDDDGGGGGGDDDDNDDGNG